MKNKKFKIVFVIVIFTFGTIVPFVDYLVVVETFYLLIPFAILFLGSLIYLIASLFIMTMNSKNAFYIACLVPVFVVSQFISTYIVDKIQRSKAELLIKEIEAAITTTRGLANSYDTSFGIGFQKLDDQNNFKISYSRGFMAIEVYYSSIKSWSGKVTAGTIRTIAVCAFAGAV
jgi:hypothetical protein